MKRLIGGLIILSLCWIALPVIAFRVYIDPGHFVGDKREPLEIETNLAVGIKLRNLLKGDNRAGIRWEVRMSREDDVGIKGLVDRAKDANNFEADLYLSIHCNGGGGTGTETFWCDLNQNGGLNPNRNKDSQFAHLVQKHMVHTGEWSCPNKPWHECRRVVEDFTYLKKNGNPFHLSVLQFSDAPGCLNEIGFVDNPVDAAKLRNDQWREQFALAYRDAIYEFFCVPLPESSETSISIRLFNGWNIISVPGVPVNPDPRSLAGRGSQIHFPLYGLKGSFFQVSQLKFGEGYWIYTHNPNGEVIEIPYIPADCYTISLKKGWNIIGSVSGRGAFEDFEGTSYRWNPITQKFSEVFPGTLEPGIGYYVYADVPGTLTVKVGGPEAPAAFEMERPISTAGLPMPPPLPFEILSTSLPRTNFVPTTNKVFANFPNPFNPETWVPFQIKQESVVTIRIHNSVGQLVRTLEVGSRAPGVYDTKERAVYWDGMNEQNEPVSSGTYFYTLQAGDFQTTKKMLLLK